MSRILISLSLAVVGALGVACADCHSCQKDPPCRPCENPCCLTPIQKVALKAGSHALNSGPVVYTFHDRTFILYSEKGQKDFEKDPVAFEEKGGVRVTRKGKTWRMDVNPGEDEDFAQYLPLARPYTAPEPTPAQ